MSFSCLLVYETFYDNFQPYFLEKNLQLGFIDCDIFVLRIRTQIFGNDSKQPENLFNFRNLNNNLEKFKNKSKKTLGNFKNATPKVIWIVEFISSKNKRFFFSMSKGKHR